MLNTLIVVQIEPPVRVRFIPFPMKGFPNNLAKASTHTGGEITHPVPLWFIYNTQHIYNITYNMHITLARHKPEHTFVKHEKIQYGQDFFQSFYMNMIGLLLPSPS